MEAFEVGRNTAVSPGAVVWQNEILQLLQFAPTTEQVPLVFERAAVSYCVAARLWGYEDIKEFVRRGLAIAGIPRMCVQEELRRGSLVELNVAGLDFYRTIRLVYRSEAYLSEGAQRLLELAREWDWHRPGARADH